MSDNHHRYRSIRIALSQMFSNGLKGYGAKQLNVYAALISGIVGSKSTNYPKIASKVPDQTKAESRVKRFSRFINEADPNQEIYLMPFAEQLLTNLSNFSLVLIMDGSDVGRNCVALMLSVQFRGRALPIGWLVISGKKGHFSQERHVQLVTAVKELVPPGADVIFLGDGEFETFFSDQKSRAFNLYKSHLSDPSRLGKLMIAACQAYLWIAQPGLWSFGQKLNTIVHRTDRCDLSLFQLGFCVLEYLLDFNLDIPVSFTDFSHVYPDFVR